MDTLAGRSRARCAREHHGASDYCSRCIQAEMLVEENPEMCRGDAEDIARYFDPAHWARRMVGLAVGVYLLFGGTWLLNRIFRGLEHNRCAKCGFNLTGLDDGAVCPECGGRPT